MPAPSAKNHRQLGATVRIPQNVVYRDFASETVVLNLDTGKYHGLNLTAGEMLAALEESGSVGAAARLIAQRHGAELDRVQDDICTLCDQLEARGLIAVGGGLG
jgi:coenzyme PQQ synthesis protein D (PqqD)